MPTRKPRKAYAAAGVDIALGDRVKSTLPRLLAAARRPEMIGTVGGFGGLFRAPRATRGGEPVLVASIDGVGTKLKLAFKTGRHAGVGRDIVNHCVNDIAVLGAEPLFFLDYIGMGRLEPRAFRDLVGGMAAACAEAGCALLGGETAQMPGMYQKGEYDVAGCIVGVVPRRRILGGEAIRPGDALVGVASSGLHTNGYSLAQKLLFEKLRVKLNDRLPGTRETYADALLRPHVSYGPLIRSLAQLVNRGADSAARRGNQFFGAAHITGGGFQGNIPRILPRDCDAVVRTASWPRPPLFSVLAERGGVSHEELHEVFNMGVGMVLVVDEAAVDRTLAHCARHGHTAWTVGEVVKGRGRVRLA